MTNGSLHLKSRSGTKRLARYLGSWVPRLGTQPTTHPGTRNFREPLKVINHLTSLSSLYQIKRMSNRTRSILKAVAVVIVLLAVVMQLRWVIIPSISEYKFWLVVISFGLLLISSK